MITDVHLSIAADLGYLRDFWANEPWSPCPDDAQIKFGSRVLRRLLFERDLGVAWKELGLDSGGHAEPVIVANQIIPPTAPAAQYLILADGEFEMGQGPMWGPPDALSTREHPLTPAQFRDASCVLASGTAITRGDLVIYFAEFVTGTHVDLVDDREVQYQELIGRVVQIEGRVTVFQTEALRHELRAMGRRTIQSSDLATLEAAIRERGGSIPKLVPPQPQPIMMASLKLSMLRNAVCAVGQLKDPLAQGAGKPQEPNFIIRGTGFLVRPRTVFTTRRLIRQLRAEIDAQTLNPDNCRIAFIQDGEDSPQLCRIARYKWVEQQTVDMGVLEFTPPDGEFREPTPLQFIGAAEYHVGMAIGVVGFGFSRLALPNDEDGGAPHITRIGPLFQSGFVSAVAPHEISKTVERLLLDLRAAEVMAGAPIVERETGLGVGIHHQREGLMTAFGLPLDDQAVKRLLELYDRQTKTVEVNPEVSHA